jgi:hypothetical protein
MMATFLAGSSVTTVPTSLKPTLLWARGTSSGENSSGSGLSSPWVPPNKLRVTITMYSSRGFMGTGSLILAFSGSAASTGRGSDLALFRVKSADNPK